MAESPDGLTARPAFVIGPANYMGKWDDWLPTYNRLTVTARASMIHLHGQHEDGVYEHCPLCLAEVRAADRIDALSADVARLTAERDDRDRAGVALMGELRRTGYKLDEARARVAERDATIERLREAVEALLRVAPRHRTEYEHDRTVCPYCVPDALARAVLADTAPTPETHVDHKPGPCKSCGTSWADCPDNEDDDTEFAGCCYGCAHPYEGSR